MEVVELEMKLLFTLLLYGYSDAVRYETSRFVPERHPNWRHVDHELCGLSMVSRVIGGREAKVGEFPWMVLIGLRAQVENKVIAVCGGTLVNRYYAISAAHCFDHKSLLPHLKVWVGEHQTDSLVDCAGGQCAPPAQVRSLHKVLLPHDYAEENKIAVNDIALLQLGSPVTLNPFVNPICLPDSALMNTDLGGVLAYLTGWGVTSQKEICAKGGDEQSACNGDSGGPLVVRVSSGRVSRYVLVGVLSYGPTPCGVTHHPDHYTRVSAFLQLILDNIHMS